MLFYCKPRVDLVFDIDSVAVARVAGMVSGMAERNGNRGNPGVPGMG